MATNTLAEEPYNTYSLFKAFGTNKGTKQSDELLQQQTDQALSLAAQQQPKQANTQVQTTNEPLGDLFGGTSAPTQHSLTAIGGPSVPPTNNIVSGYQGTPQQANAATSTSANAAPLIVGNAGGGQQVMQNAQGLFYYSNNPGALFAANPLANTAGTPQSLNATLPNYVKPSASNNLPLNQTQNVDYASFGSALGDSLTWTSPTTFTANVTQNGVTYVLSGTIPAMAGIGNQQYQNASLVPQAAKNAAVDAAYAGIINTGKQPQGSTVTLNLDSGTGNINLPAGTTTSEGQTTWSGQVNLPGGAVASIGTNTYGSPIINSITNTQNLQLDSSGEVASYGSGVYNYSVNILPDGTINTTTDLNPNATIPAYSEIQIGDVLISNPNPYPTPLSELSATENLTQPAYSERTIGNQIIENSAPITESQTVPVNLFGKTTTSTQIQPPLNLGAGYTAYNPYPFTPAGIVNAYLNTPAQAQALANQLGTNPYAGTEISLLMNAPLAVAGGTGFGFASPELAAQYIPPFAIGGATLGAGGNALYSTLTGQPINPVSAGLAGLQGAESGITTAPAFAGISPALAALLEKYPILANAYVQALGSGTAGLGLTNAYNLATGQGVASLPQDITSFATSAAAPSLFRGLGTFLKNPSAMFYNQPTAGDFALGNQPIFDQNIQRPTGLPGQLNVYGYENPYDYLNTIGARQIGYYPKVNPEATITSGPEQTQTTIEYPEKQIYRPNGQFGGAKISYGIGNPEDYQTAYQNIANTARQLLLQSATGEGYLNKLPMLNAYRAAMNPILLNANPATGYNVDVYTSDVNPKTGAAPGIYRLESPSLSQTLLRGLENYLNNAFEGPAARLGPASSRVIPVGQYATRAANLPENTYQMLSTGEMGSAAGLQGTPVSYTQRAEYYPNWLGRMFGQGQTGLLLGGTPETMPPQVFQTKSGTYYLDTTYNTGQGQPNEPTIVILRNLNVAPDTGQSYGMNLEQEASQNTQLQEVPTTQQYPIRTELRGTINAEYPEAQPLVKYITSRFFGEGAPNAPAEQGKGISTLSPGELKTLFANTPKPPALSLDALGVPTIEYMTPTELAGIEPEPGFPFEELSNLASRMLLYNGQPENAPPEAQGNIMEQARATAAYRNSGLQLGENGEQQMTQTRAPGTPSPNGTPIQIVTPPPPSEVFQFKPPSTTTTPQFTAPLTISALQDYPLEVANNLTPVVSPQIQLPYSITTQSDYAQAVQNAFVNLLLPQIIEYAINLQQMQGISQEQALDQALQNIQSSQVKTALEQAIAQIQEQVQEQVQEQEQIQEEIQEQIQPQTIPITPPGYPPIPIPVPASKALKRKKRRSGFQKKYPEQFVYFPSIGERLFGSAPGEYFNSSPENLLSGLEARPEPYALRNGVVYGQPIPA